MAATQAPSVDSTEIVPLFPTLVWKIQLSRDTYEPVNAPLRTFPFGVHVAQVEVDRETGLVQILKYLVSEDIGRAVNPMLVEGQMVGGFAQGLGGALLEEFVFNSDGQPLATSFMDYLLPTAMEVPLVELLSVEECLSPSNPLGVKGAGEGGIVAVGGAMANAVSDALGTEVTLLPMKPEYVRNLARPGVSRPQVP